MNTARGLFISCGFATVAAVAAVGVAEIRLEEAMHDGRAYCEATSWGDQRRMHALIEDTERVYDEKLNNGMVHFDKKLHDMSSTIAEHGEAIRESKASAIIGMAAAKSLSANAHDLSEYMNQAQQGLDGISSELNQRMSVLFKKYEESTNRQIAAHLEQNIRVFDPEVQYPEDQYPEEHEPAEAAGSDKEAASDDGASSDEEAGGAPQRGEEE
jgi:hypothetical protein